MYAVQNSLYWYNNTTLLTVAVVKEVGVWIADCGLKCGWVQVYKNPIHWKKSVIPL